MQFSVQMAKRFSVKWKIPVTDVWSGCSAPGVELIVLKCIYCIGNINALVINKTVLNWCDLGVLQIL